MLFIGLTLVASFFRLRRTRFEKRWLLAIFVGAILPAIAANELGWAAAEVGRQPWVVHPRVLKDASGNILFGDGGFVQYRTEEGLKTSDAVSESVAAGQVLGSIIMFGVIYVLLFAVWIYVLNHKIHVGPDPFYTGAGTTGAGILAAAGERVEHEFSLVEGEKDDR